MRFFGLTKIFELTRNFYDMFFTEIYYKNSDKRGKFLLINRDQNIFRSQIKRSHDGFVMEFRPILPKRAGFTVNSATRSQSKLSNHLVSLADWWNCRLPIAANTILSFGDHKDWIRPSPRRNTLWIILYDIAFLLARVVFCSHSHLQFFCEKDMGFVDVHTESTAFESDLLS